MLTAAAAYYHGVLPSKIREEWYRKRYGFSDETIGELLLGWADGHLYQHLTELLGATEEEALATGLFVRLKGGRIEDFFRDRLVFPYWRHGRVVYFIARATEHTGEEPDADLVDKARAAPRMQGLVLVSRVTTREPYTWTTGFDAARSRRARSRRRCCSAVSTSGALLRCPPATTM